MNLSISQANMKANNVSFGMANFTERGLRYAKSCGDTYAPLDTPNSFQDPAFFEKKKAFKKAPFTKYFEKMIPAKEPKAENITEVAQTIVSCGATPNSFSNALFIKQLLATDSQVKSVKPEVRKYLSESIATVFEKNWNNPMLSKEETLGLLELSRPTIDDKQYVTLTGVIEKSDAKTPKAR